MSAQAIYQGDGSVRLTFPYDEAFITQLKDEIPYPHRHWHKPEKLWIIDTWYSRRAVRMLVARWPGAEVVDCFATRHPAPPAGVYAVFHLLPTAPPQVVEASYRELVKLHHPDHVPEHERAAAHLKTVALNDAIAKLRQLPPGAEARSW